MTNAEIRDLILKYIDDKGDDFEHEAICSVLIDLKRMKLITNKEHVRFFKFIRSKLKPHNWYNSIFFKNITAYRFSTTYFFKPYNWKIRIKFLKRII